MQASVILTRPEGMNERLAERLCGAGMKPVVLPALVLQPRSPNKSGFPDASNYDVVVFVSGNAVRFYMRQRNDMITDAMWPRHTRVAAVGLATALAAEQAGVPASQIIRPDAADGQDSEALWERLRPYVDSSTRVLVVRGDSGREWLSTRLQEAGASVERYAAYERRPARWSNEQAVDLSAALEATANRICVLTSSEGLDAVYANFTQLGLADEWLSLRFAVVHERIAARLQSIFCASGKVAPRMVKISQPSDDAIFLTVVQMATLSASS